MNAKKLAIRTKNLMKVDEIAVINFTLSNNLPEKFHVFFSQKFLLVKYLFLP